LEATPEEPLRVLFLGNFRHLPNVEALQFLKEHLIPVFPKLQFQVAGNNLPIGVLDGTEAEMLGYQFDTRLLYKRPNTIVLAPLFSGTGQRVKLLEAFSMGVPVVTTSRGASGFAVRHGVDAFLAETPAQFQIALATLCDSRKLRENVGENARRLVTERFDWDALASYFLGVIEPDDVARENY